MEVILLDKVANLGALGDQVNVRPGYGRNFLIPRGKAVMASAANKEAFEARRQELEKAAAEVLGAAQARAAKLNGLTVEIACKAGDEGKLFGSIGTVDIAGAIASATAAEFEKNEVRLPEGALRHIGSYEVEMHLHADVSENVTVVVVPEA